MNREEYLENILEDGQTYIDETLEHYEDKPFWELFEDMRVRITGAIDGSYYCSEAKAEKAVRDVLFNYSILDDMQREGFDMPLMEGPCACDVAVRYVLFGYLYDELKDYFFEKLENK